VGGWNWHWRCQHRHPSLDGAWTGECTSRQQRTWRTPSPACSGNSGTADAPGRENRLVPIWIAACRVVSCVPVPVPVCLYLPTRGLAVTCMQPHPMLHAPCAHIPHPTSHIPHAKRTPNDTLVAAADGIVDSRPSSVVAFLRDARPWRICSQAAVSISTSTARTAHTAPGLYSRARFCLSQQVGRADESRGMGAVRRATAMNARHHEAETRSHGGHQPPLASLALFANFARGDPWPPRLSRPWARDAPVSQTLIDA
jgi:hypothetical protein